MSNEKVFLIFLLLLTISITSKPSRGCEINYNVTIKRSSTSLARLKVNNCSDLELSLDNPQFSVNDCRPKCKRQGTRVLLQTKKGQGSVQYGFKVNVSNLYDDSGQLGQIGNNYGLMFEEHLLLSPTQPETVSFSQANMELPQGWRLVSPRRVVNNTVTVNGRLRGAYLGFGKFKIYEVEGDNYKIILASYPATKLPERRLTRLLNHSIAYLGALYGETPFDKLVVYSTGMMPGGTLKDDSFFVGNESKWSWYIHELQHQWLGITAKFDKDQHWHWFAEGVINYYSGKLLVKDGLWSPYKFKKLLNKAGKPQTLPQGATMDNEYQKRLSAASLALVNYLNESAEGRFPEIVQEIYQRGKKDPISNSEIEESLEVVTGKNYQWFFDKYIYRRGWLHRIKDKMLHLVNILLSKLGL